LTPSDLSIAARVSGWQFRRQQLKANDVRGLAEQIGRMGRECLGDPTLKMGLPASIVWRAGCG